MTDQPPLDLTRPFTRAQARAAGITDRQLASEFRKIGHGRYLARHTTWDEAARLRDSLTQFPCRAFASHASAARLLKLPIPTLPDDHVTVPHARFRRRMPHLRVHVRTAIPTVMRRQGVLISAPGQLFGELAELLTLVDLVVVGDHLVRQRLASIAELKDAAATVTGRAGELAQWAASLVRERVDSPRETRLRLLLIFAGCPEPEVNLTLHLDDGAVERRFDLSWPSVKVIAEFDGRHHIEREEQWENDLVRREQIENDAWRILVFTNRDLVREPERTLQRIWSVLAARGLAGLPDRPGDEWRRHLAAYG